MEAGDTAGAFHCGVGVERVHLCERARFRSRKPLASLCPVLTCVMGGGGGGVWIGRLYARLHEFEQQIPALRPCRVPESQHLVF